MEFLPPFSQQGAQVAFHGELPAIAVITVDMAADADG